MTNSFDRAPASMDAFLRDIERHPVPSAEVALAMARRIVVTRADLWTALLDYMPTMGRVFDAIAAATRDGSMPDAHVDMLGLRVRRDRGLCGDAEFSAAVRRIAWALANRKSMHVARPLVADFVLALKSGESSDLACIGRNVTDREDFAPQVALLERMLRQHDHQRNRYATANLRLVVSTANRMRGWIRSLAFEDMVQEGSIGLLRAIDTFDPERGNKFSTYATWWIKHCIVRGAVDRGRVIRIPAHMHDRAWRMLTESKKVYRATGQWPTPEEAARAAGLTMQQAEAVYDAFGGTLLGSEHTRVVSLDKPLGENGDTIGDTDVPLDHVSSEEDSPDVVIDTARRAREAMAVVESDALTERERSVVHERFGLAGVTPGRLDDVGRRLGVSREGARQIEMRALRKLREQVVQP